LATALAEAGAKVGLWASDQSAALTPLVPPGSSVERITGTETEVLERFGEPEILHDNGIWLPHNHRLAMLAERRGIPRVVSTRGMLEPWALRHKGIKKKLAWLLYQKGDLIKARCHHATAEVEAQNVRRLRLGVPVIAVPNGVDVATRLSRSVGLIDKDASQGEPRVALFLGRIYPVKGLPMLIEAWARVRPHGWVLRIAGPDEAGHRREVERAVSAVGLNHVVDFRGPLEGHSKESAFAEADLFVLTSYSESFGMGIAEALAHGLPVLTTTGAPWPMLPKEGCGWWVDPTVDCVTEGLRQATSLNSESLREMGEKGRALVTAEFSWKSVAARMLTNYKKIVANDSACLN